MEIEEPELELGMEPERQREHTLDDDWELEM
jgi:hypothetical protein